jgi:ATP adenylyltransferase
METKCIFCEAIKKEDEEALILYRGKHNFIIMNLFPYNTGHLMIAPYRHIASPEEANSEELQEMVELMKFVLELLRKAYQPHGFNIGMNIGRASGAGVDKHYHLHIVPRWEGDTNFMAVFDETKVIARDVKDVYRELKKLLKI